jgi:DNA-binding response OmpR family regulator
MSKPLTNRSIAGNVVRRRRTDYMHKVRTVDVETLVASLILRHRNLELDRLSRVFRINGRPCPLTRLEFELLTFLLLNRGQVMSKDVLMEHIWQREQSSINLIAVYIVNLRKKIGPGILRTVRGQGYTIDPDKSGRLSVVSRQSSNRAPGKTRL